MPSSSGTKRDSKVIIIGNEIWLDTMNVFSFCIFYILDKSYF